MANSGLILFAEDDRRLRKLYTDTLKAAGYNVITAADGDEVLELLHTVKPKLLLLDVMMPNLNGIETCRRARKIIGSEVPIVFLTALDQLSNVHDCIAAGGDDYIVKSDGVAAIIQRVGQWVQHKPGRKRLSARRDDMLVDVVAEVDRDTAAANLSSETDETVREISEFLSAARVNAADDFGRTLEEKTYLLGYVTGIVEHWSEMRESLDGRFLDYLGAILRETDVLADDEVSQMVAGFDDLSADTYFGIARAYGRNDPAQREKLGDDYTPIGLSQFIPLATSE
jgi:DNA-binding response OmpR family regulator